MRIALLSYEYPPETGFGGIGTYTWHHARALVQLGHEVHVFAGALNPQPIATDMDGGVRVHRFRADGPLIRGIEAGLNRVRYWWTKQRLLNAWGMARAFAKLHRHHPFDVVEAPECGGEAAWLTAVSRVPTVIRLHSPSQLIMPFYEVRPGDIRGCSLIERQAIRRATAISACSRFVAEEAGRAIGLPRPATVISNGLDLEWFDRVQADDGSALEDFGLPKDQPVILFVGRLEGRKGIHICGEIATRVLGRYKASLVFVGSDLFGHYRDGILPALANQPLLGSVHWLGHRSIGEIRRLVRQCQVFLLPSVWENCPYSCLEAMAAGRAVVCSEQGGLPEIIRDGENGLLARLNDPADFARRIGTLIENPTLARQLGMAARKSIEENHGHTHIARQTLDLYRTLCRETL